MLRMYISYIVGLRGPFSRPWKMGKSEDLHRLATSPPPPTGPPVSGNPWILYAVGSEKPFGRVLNGLFARNIIVRFRRSPFSEITSLSHRSSVNSFSCYFFFYWATFCLSVGFLRRVQTPPRRRSLPYGIRSRLPPGFPSGYGSFSCVFTMGWS